LYLYKKYIMSELTKFSLGLINTIGIYFILTLPFATKIMFNYGYVYPSYLIVICSILSVIGSKFLTDWEINKINKKST
jgi:hypothetical protein